MNTELPEDFSCRAPTPEDLPAVFDLIIACDIADAGEPDNDVADLQADWARARFHLATDAWLVRAPDGQLAAYGDVWAGDRVRVNPSSCVHPHYRHRGIGTFLLHRAEAWARENIPETPRVIQTIVLDSNLGARRLMEREGYQPVRYDWQMRIDMQTPPPMPQWPPGVMVRTFERGRDERMVHAIIQEAFRDTWNHPDMPYDMWATFIFRGNFDPTVSYLVKAGDEPVAATMSFVYPNGGWVRQIGVRRAWREHGIGLALLHQTFGEYYRRGIRRVGLGVDSESLTGATRLYERAGMRVVRQFNRYQKAL
jgi:mycothiol synthase